MKTVNSLLIGLIFLASCGGSSSEQKETSSNSDRDEIRLKQYMVQGKALYQTYCSACHQANGEGLAQLYPPLAKSDYLMSDFERAACVVKNGLQGEVVVNGITYNQVMIANASLTPLEIAEILTYAANSWGNDGGLIATKEVTKWLSSCAAD